MNPLAPPDLAPFDGTPLAQEHHRLQAGEPWRTTPVAGLQFYSYGEDDDLVGRVLPRPGDPVSLMRRPDNAADGRAVEAWWRNRFLLGHLPRDLAWDIAPQMDAGRSCRAYVWAPGNGSAWSLRLLLVGAAVEPVHAQQVRAAVKEAARTAALRIWPSLPQWEEVPESERRGWWRVLSKPRLPPTARQRRAAEAWAARRQAAQERRQADAAHAFSQLAQPPADRNGHAAQHEGTRLASANSTPARLRTLRSSP